MRNDHTPPFPLNIYSELSKATVINDDSVMATLLTREMVLYIKTRYFQWMAGEAHFMEIGILLEYQCKKLVMTIAGISGNLNKPGMQTIFTPEESLPPDDAAEIPGIHTSPIRMLEELLNDHEAIMHHLRKQADEFNKKQKDSLTAGILTVWLEAHVSTVWALRKQLVQISGRERQWRRIQINE